MRSHHAWIAGQLTKELELVGAHCFLDASAIETGDEFDAELSTTSTSTLMSYGEESTMADLFISYSRRDETPFVRAVVEELRAKGFESWFSDDDLVAGASFRDESAEALAASNVLVVFVGAGESESPWLNFEIGAALGRDKPVVPVYLTATGGRDAPGVLAHFASIDAHDQRPDAVAQQIADILERA